VKADSWKQEQGKYNEEKKAIEFEIMTIRSIGSRMSKLIKNRKKEKNVRNVWNLKERIAYSRKSEKKKMTFSEGKKENVIGYVEDRPEKKGLN